MDQKIRTAGWFLTAVLLGFCAFIFFILGISMLASYPDGIWLVGLLLTVCGIVVAVSAINNYRAAKSEQKISEEQMRIINTKIPGGAESKIEVLATWFYSGSEWKTFMKWEQKERGSGTMIQTILIIILGTLAIRFYKGGDWYTALAISVSIGLMFGVLKYLSSQSSIKLQDNKMPEVIITTDAIIVNGHMNRFYGNNLWLGKVMIKEAGALNVLEITYCWDTRRGQSSDEIRVPIPKGSLKEAIFLQERLMNERK